MKIADIKIYPVWVGSRNQLLVKVETDEGIYGWGEAGLSFRELAVAGAVRHFREFLLGRDPLQRGALWQEMYRSQYFEGGRVLTAAISAIDIALHDIVGKALNVPIFELLGGKQRDFIPCFATTGAHGDRLIEDVKLLIAEGWNVIRTVPSHPQRMTGSPMNVASQQAKRGFQPEDFSWEPRDSIAPTAADLVRVREELGSDFVLGIDYHHRLNIAETASFCQRMPSGTLDFIEEPIRDETPEAYEALRRMVDIPFAIGEEFSSKWAYVPYIERNITDFVRIDISNVGGFTEAMKVAGWAEAHYIDLMPHNPLGPICTAATVHLAAAAANFSWLEVRQSPTEQLGFYDETVFPVQLKLEGSRFPLPSTPGLGVEVDEAYVARQEFKFAEAPHLRKRDGSYTNW